MKRTLSGIVGASLVLGAMQPEAFAPVRKIETGGYALDPVVSRGYSRQAFASVAGKRSRRNPRGVNGR